MGYERLEKFLSVISGLRAGLTMKWIPSLFSVQTFVMMPLCGGSRFLESLVCQEMVKQQFVDIHGAIASLGHVGHSYANTLTANISSQL